MSRVYLHQSDEVIAPRVATKCQLSIFAELEGNSDIVGVDEKFAQSSRHWRPNCWCGSWQPRGGPGRDFANGGKVDVFNG